MQPFCNTCFFRKDPEFNEEFNCIRCAPAYSDDFFTDRSFHNTIKEYGLMSPLVLDEQIEYLCSVGNVTHLRLINQLFPGYLNHSHLATTFEKFNGDYVIQLIKT